MDDIWYKYVWTAAGMWFLWEGGRFGGLNIFFKLRAHILSLNMLELLISVSVFWGNFGRDSDPPKPSVGATPWLFYALRHPTNWILICWRFASTNPDLVGWLTQNVNQLDLVMDMNLWQPIRSWYLDLIRPNEYAWAGWPVCGSIRRGCVTPYGSKIYYKHHHTPIIHPIIHPIILRAAILLRNFRFPIISPSY